MKMSNVRLIIKNLEQLVQVCCNRERYKRGDQQSNLALLQRRNDGVGCCLVVDNNGYIADIGYDDQLLDKYVSETVIDGEHCSLIPGLVDSHTHPVFAGDRCFEFDLKMKGATYLDIHNKGGGIYYTVQQTKNASFEYLLSLLKQRINQMLACGTTFIECKTGYGLDFDTELKMLRVIDWIRNNQCNVDVVVNFLAAHAIPKGMTAEEGVNTCIDIMQRIKQEWPQIKVDFVDAFCEKGVYDSEQTKRILLKGKELFDAKISFHGDELSSTSSGELAKEINAKAVSHLEYISDAGIQAMSEANVVAIVCPTTAYLLRLQSPPVRDMIKRNVAVAVATDFNPNAYCYSLPMAMNLAVVKFGLSLDEALVATTINAAFALNVSDKFGSLEVGKVADMVLINGDHWTHLIYEFGDTRNVIKNVIKKGVIVK